jgi:hypothetical protein
VTAMTISEIPSASQILLLRAIDEHGAVPRIELIRLAEQADLDVDIQDFLRIWSEGGLLETSGELVKIRDSAAAALFDLSHMASAEDEDIVSDESPTKPYEVSKLKVEQRALSVFQALRKIENNEINIAPEFQRAFVWDIVRQSRLIESILIRIPLPAFYLDATNEIKWNVVDGLQRLSTLFRYCRGQSFGLEGLEFLTELNGKRFLELPKKYQVLIEDDTQLIFNNLLPGTPTRAKFTIFSRVNTGGLQLTPQEIRHALNQGPITGALKLLSIHPTFLRGTAGSVSSKRMADRELILRAMAFLEFGFEGYREYGDFDTFLVDSMEKFNTTHKHKIGVASKELLDSVDKAIAIFGRYAFRKTFVKEGRRNPFNKALFEAWVVNLSSYPKEKLVASRDSIVDESIKLMSGDEAFLRSITYATGSTASIRTRLEKVRDVLSASVNIWP